MNYFTLKKIYVIVGLILTVLVSVYYIAVVWYFLTEEIYQQQIVPALNHSFMSYF